ncbi:MAG: homoserine kinase [Betaproteobacteria bacterium]
MSVYTPVTALDLDAWLLRYAVGALAELAPIASGIENTNYFVTTARGRYVLTLYERLPAAELPFYLNLMAHLARAGVEVPAPVPDRTGALFSLLNGKPAGLVARVDGVPVAAPDAAHCALVGAALARLHLASQTYRARLTNRRGPAWWRQAARAVRPHLTAAQAALLDAEIKFQTGFGRDKLPKGAIHGDLFCDNVLFAGEHVAGIIDFGFAATDFFAYDLAITVNDWCIADASGRLDPAFVAAMLSAYDSLRPLTRDECESWPALLRAAALRFWLSRLYDLHLPRPGELTHAHDPAHFERILRERASTPARCPLPERADS